MLGPCANVAHPWPTLSTACGADNQVCGLRHFITTNFGTPSPFMQSWISEPSRSNRNASLAQVSANHPTLHKGEGGIKVNPQSRVGWGRVGSRRMDKLGYGGVMLGRVRLQAPRLRPRGPGIMATLWPHACKHSQFYFCVRSPLVAQAAGKCHSVRGGSVH